ncbi:MAG: GNAT family N-acetyltransferase [Rhodospirillales bacterium]|nr:GNAT family N-acetyltransferase [Rhodospirillales bacterium]
MKPGPTICGVIGATSESTEGSCEAGYREAFDDTAADLNHMMIIPDCDGVVTGCLQLSFLPGFSLGGMRRDQIEGMHIASNRRSEGLGGVLLNWAIEHCRECGCGMVQITMNKNRDRTWVFYERVGFVTSHDGMKLKCQSSLVIGFMLQGRANIGPPAGGPIYFDKLKHLHSIRLIQSDRDML